MTNSKTEYIHCYQCNGRGYTFKPHMIGIMMMQHKEDCTACQGRGYIIKRKCATFRFNGSTDADRERCFCVGEYYTGEEDPENNMSYIVKDDNGDEWRIPVDDKEFKVYDIFNQ